MGDKGAIIAYGEKVVKSRPTWRPSLDSFSCSFPANPCNAALTPQRLRGSLRGIALLRGSRFTGRCQRFWLARNMTRRGGNHPRPGFPLWGNGKGDPISCAARLILGSHSTRFASAIRMRSSTASHALSALVMGFVSPVHAGVSLGVRVLDGPGIVRALPSSYRSPDGPSDNSQSPEQGAVDVVETKAPEMYPAINSYLGHRHHSPEFTSCSLLFHAARISSNRALATIYFAAYPQFVQQYTASFRAIPRQPLSSSRSSHHARTSRRSSIPSAALHPARMATTMYCALTTSRAPHHYVTCFY